MSEHKAVEVVANALDEILRPGPEINWLRESRHIVKALETAGLLVEESTAALKLVNSQPILVPSNPPVDDSRLREMALSMASRLVSSGEFVTTRAQEYLDFLKGDAEPKQPPFADGEGVFE